MPPPRIGLLGGTFDPPHVGHLIAAEVARVGIGLDEVQFVVAGDPWMKRVSATGEQRVRMTELAVERASRFKVNRSEVDRQGVTYTAETLEHMVAEKPEAELYFLLGTDAARRLPEWKEVERALDLATFVALKRPGYVLELEAPYEEQVRRLEMPRIDVSSTDLRRRFRAGAAVRFQLPRVVEEYVRAHGLYGAAPEPA